MKAVCVSLLLAIAGPALAETPAPSPAAPAPDSTAKPYVYDSNTPGLMKGFTEPTPVIIGPVGSAPAPAPKFELRAPVAPTQKPLPPPKTSVG